MKKNIRDYMNNNYSDSENLNNNNSAVNMNDIPPDVKGKVDNYSRMSESQLMNEMNKLAFQGKNNGTVTAESLQSFYNQVSPMLSQQQRTKLKQLINSLSWTNVKNIVIQSKYYTNYPRYVIMIKMAV